MYLRVNPSARLDTISLYDGETCLIVDDVLLNPDELVAYAEEHADRFGENSRFNYPGIELSLPSGSYSELLEQFRRRWRKPLAMGRPIHESDARLSLVTLKPEDLRPEQRVCHTDAPPPNPSMVAAGIIYLFRDPELGGTLFFRETGGLEADSFQETERRQYLQHRSGYMTRGDPFFEHMETVKARYNRLAIYPGHVYHSGQIEHPEMLSSDPRKGRLTVNLFIRGVRL